jgi:hypothetical protein
MRDVYAAIAPRPALVINPMGSRRTPAERVAAWEHLDWTAQVYEAADSPEGFTLKTQVASTQMREVLVEWFQS